MTIHKTPYDTTAGLGYRYANIAQELRTALAGGGLAVHNAQDGQHRPNHSSRNTDAQFKIALVQGGNSFADSVHFFKHPVFVRYNEQEYICVDVRDYGKWDANQQRFQVRNTTEFVWSVKRALLTCIWNDERTGVVRDLSNLPAQTYCALINESIGRRFALDAAEQATIAVLAGYFYYSLFSDETSINEDDKNNLAGKLSRITNVDASRVFQIIDPLEVVDSVEKFCAAVKFTVSNVALENLNAGTFFNVVSGNWFGTNAREVLSMAIEHVPTWTMIVSASLSSQTFKRSTLAKITARFDKRGAGDSFVQALSALLGGPEGVSDLEIYSNFFGSA